MAVFSVIAKHSRMGDTIRYVSNSKKTKIDKMDIKDYFSRASMKYLYEGKLISGVNCHVDNVQKEMIFVQERYAQRNSGIECFHGIQSFKSGEVTSLECHRIGVEFAELCWGSDYQVLVATHVNTDQYHNHFVINPVSMWNGKKWQFRKTELNRCRLISDYICKEHGLSVIKHPVKGSKTVLNQIEYNGGATKFNLMRESLEKVLSISASIEELCVCMRFEGYIIEYQIEGPLECTIKTGSDKYPIRLERLGDYTGKKLKERFDNNRFVDRYKTISKYKEHIKEEERYLSRNYNHIVSEVNNNHWKERQSLNEQYRSLMSFLEPISREMKRDDDYPLIFSPECKLALRRIKWHRQLAALCEKYRIDKHSEIKEKIDALSAKTKEITDSKERKLINSEIKVLKSLGRHSSKILKILSSEREEQYKRIIVQEKGICLPDKTIDSMDIFPEGYNSIIRGRERKPKDLLSLLNSGWIDTYKEKVAEEENRAKERYRNQDIEYRKKSRDDIEL